MNALTHTPDDIFQYCGYYGTQTRKKLLSLLQAKKISILDAPASTANLNTVVTPTITPSIVKVGGKKVITKRRMLTIR